MRLDLESRQAPRVAVTGVGLVCALGQGAHAAFERLVRGDVAIAPVTLFDVSAQRCQLAAQVADLDVARVAPAGDADTWSRSDAMAMLAAREALRHAALANHDSISVAVGGTTGGMFEAEEVLARDRGELGPAAVRRLLGYPLCASADRLARGLPRVARTATLCSACSSSANALVQAAAWLVAGHSDVALAGGTDGLCRLTFTGFNALGVMSPEPCRPFDAARSGLSLGEGAAFLVLETEEHARARGAKVLAWLDGWAVASEAYHITHPEPSAHTASALIRGALERAGLAPSDVDYVNAHGTATPQNDSSEARALADALGPELARIRVSSSKGQVGHTLGAAGAIEAVFSVLAIAQGIAPPTRGLEQPDPLLPLHHVLGVGERLPIRAALSTSFGFGGTGTVLAFSKPTRTRSPLAAPRVAVVVSGSSAYGPFGALRGSDVARGFEAPGDPHPARLDLLSSLDAARSRRFDRASALVTLGAASALDLAGLAPEATGLAAGSAYGNVERSVEFLRRAFERGPRFASPAEFPHLVPSGPVGNASIYLGLTGPTFGVNDLGTSAEAALASALSLLELGLAQAFVAGSAEPFDPVVERVFTPLLGGAAAANARRGESASWLVLEAAASCDARGARPLAALRFWRQECADMALLPPRDSARSVVVPSSDAVRSAPWLAASAWSGVAQRRIPPMEIPPEARGGAALALAVALVARGDAQEALVVSQGATQAYAFCFGAVK